MRISHIILTGILSLGFFGNSVADLNDGLVAYYPLNGNANDESGNGNHGTEQGGVEYTNSEIGQAATFDGMNDYIHIPFATNIHPSIFSLSVWFNTTETGRGTFITSDPNSHQCNHGYELGLFNGKGWMNADPTSRCGDGIVIKSNDVLNDEVWHHIVGVFDGSQVKLYVDGLLQNHTANTSTYSKPSSSLRIGMTKNTGGLDQRIYNGAIDEIRIYNRALSESEIQELFQENTNSCTEDYIATVTPNLDIHLPSLNYQSLTESLDLWVELEFHGRNGNDLLWKLNKFGENKGSEVACESDEAVTVLPNLDIQLKSIDYQLLSGTLNLWANFEYYGQSDQGELLWKLIDYGEN